MATPLASLRLNARGFAAAGAFLVSAFAIDAAAGPAWAATIGAESEAHFVILSEGTGSESSFNSTSDDYRRAMALRTGSGGLLYVRENGAAYVIRDAATLRRVEAIMEPQRRLGDRQAALGRQQSALGEKQAALGEQQERIGAMMADARIREMPALGRQQEELGRGQAQLGEQQSALGVQQGALGEQQARLSKIAEANLSNLVRDAIQHGLAQRVS